MWVMPGVVENSSKSGSFLDLSSATKDKSHSYLLPRICRIEIFVDFWMWVFTTF